MDFWFFGTAWKKLELPTNLSLLWPVTSYTIRIAYLYFFPSVITKAMMWDAGIRDSVFVLQVPAALWGWSYIGWALMASGSTGKSPEALPITALTSMAPKASSPVPQGLVSVSAMSLRYPVGMCILWWSHQLLKQDWSLLSVQKKYIQVKQVMILYLKLTFNSDLWIKTQGSHTYLLCVKFLYVARHPKFLCKCDALLLFS